MAFLRTPDPSEPSKLAHRNRLITHSILPQQTHDLVQTPSTRSILMEEITGQKDKVHLCVSGDLQDLSKGIDSVLSPHRVFLGVSNVVVGSEEDAETAVLLLLNCQGERTKSRD